MECSSNISCYNKTNLIEEEVGIIEFVGHHDGFSANIKKRYSDFHVNEISPNGKILHFSNTIIPAEPQDDSKSKPPLPEELSKEQLCDLQKMASLKVKKILIKSMDENTGEEHLKIEDEPRIDVVELDVTELNKDRRTAIHFYIKDQFPDLSSTTIIVSDKKYIRVNPNKVASHERKKRSKGRECTHFVMYKENVDTMQAVGFLASILKMKSARFSYAGTKDKRGITSQAVSVLNVPPTNILNACKPIRNVHVGNFSFSEKGLCLGMLGGNNFKIALRDVTANSDIIAEACQSLRLQGFINYYGMQRFGVRSTRTYEIGKEILHYRWKNAIDLILEATDADKADLAEAKQVWKSSRKAADAYKILSARSKSLIEGRLLHGLSLKHSNDFVGALQMVPRNTRLMYVHGYQSYVWNKVVSRRIKEFGLKVLAGDLVKGKQGAMDEELESQEQQTLDQKVRYIDEESINGDSLSEVVFPLPGHSNIYPNNVVKEWYSEILAEDGFTVDSFAGSVKQYSLRGAYRHVLLKPNNFSYTICHYEDETKPLIQSDLENMSGIDISANRLEKGAHKAVLIDFELPPSSYATMALRELTKVTAGFWAKPDCNKRKFDAQNGTNKKLKEDDNK